MQEGSRDVSHISVEVYTGKSVGAGGDRRGQARDRCPAPRFFVPVPFRRRSPQNSRFAGNRRLGELTPMLSVKVKCRMSAYSPQAAPVRSFPSGYVDVASVDAEGKCKAQYSKSRTVGRCLASCGDNGSTERCHSPRELEISRFSNITCQNGSSLPLGSWKPVSTFLCVNLCSPFTGTNGATMR